MMYVPKDLNNGTCCYVVNGTYIRMYKTCINNNNNQIIDFYPDTELFRHATATYSSTTVCEPSANFTTDYWHSLKIADSVSVAGFLLIILVGIPTFLISRVFKRRW